MKNLRSLIFSFLLVSATAVQAVTINSDDIVVIFDNDVHGHVEGYPYMAALRRDMLRITPNVLTISLGDFSQGGPLCSISHGEYAVDILNRIGYDYVTLGNHEFDYGLDQLHKLTSTLTGETLVCNFRDLRNDSLVFKPYVVRRFGDLKVGIIGVVAPITKTSDSPHSFVDAQGNDIYTFGRPDFYDVIQKNIDEVKALGADFIMLMAHLGDIDYFIETSEETIRRTNGIDAVIDGHAHHVIPGRIVRRSDGKQVPLISTGSHFRNIGRLVIHPDGTTETDLIDTKNYPNTDQSISMLISSFEEAFNHLPTMAKCEFDLAGFDTRYGTYDRAMQTNLGTLCSDAFRLRSRADIGWINAGGIRASIPAGNITFKELLAIFPFENHMCVAEVTGRQIADALEFGVRRAPLDNGSYPQVSGLRFNLDLRSYANIETDESGKLIKVLDGQRRVTDITVLNPETNEYEPLDYERTYRLASIDFILKNKGCGGMFADCKIVEDNQMIDTQLLEEYLTENLHGVVGDEYQEVKKLMK